MASVRSPSSSLFSAALLACALSVTPGCSLAIQGPEPDRPRNEVPKCDTGKGLVAMDGLWGSLFGLTALGAFSDDATEAGVALIGASALFVASAVRGNNAANRCRGEYEEYNTSLMRQQRELVTLQSGGLGPVNVPAVKKRPLRPKPVYDPQQPPAVEPTPPEPPAAPEPVAPEYATPRPIVKPAQPVPAPAPPAKKPAPVKPPADPDEEDWGNFWKVVP